MIRRPCSRCQTINPRENQFCGRCGASLVVHTIIFSQDENEPYHVETTERPPWPNMQPAQEHVRQAVTVGAAAVAAELALAYVERRFLSGRSLGSVRMRQVRNGALRTLAGAAMLIAEQSLAVWSGSGPGGS